MLRAAVGSALTRPTLPHATHSCRKGRVRAHKAYEENGLRVPYCAGGTLEPKTTGRTGGTIKFTKTTQHVKSPRVCAFRPPRTDASRRARDETEPAPRTPGQKMGPFPGPKWVAQKVKVNNAPSPFAPPILGRKMAPVFGPFSGWSIRFPKKRAEK